MRSMLTVLALLAAAPGAGAAPCDVLLLHETHPPVWLRLKLPAEVADCAIQVRALPAALPASAILRRVLAMALDRDRDGKLSRAELDAAVQRARSLDIDEDECLTPFELAPALLTEPAAANERPRYAIVTTRPGKK